MFKSKNISENFPERRDKDVTFTKDRKFSHVIQYSTNRSHKNKNSNPLGVEVRICFGRTSNNLWRRSAVVTEPLLNKFLT